MPTDTYSQYPALRPTVLVHEVTKTVYVPTTRDLPPAARPGAIEGTIARETPRAA